jgi:hypothetical protein
LVYILGRCQLEFEEFRNVDEYGDEDYESKVKSRPGFVLQGMTDGVKSLSSDRNDHVNATW